MTSVKFFFFNFFFYLKEATKIIALPLDFFPHFLQKLISIFKNYNFHYYVYLYLSWVLH